MSPLHLVFTALVFASSFVQGIHAASPAGAPATLRTTVSGDQLSVPLALSYQQVVLEKRSGSGWKPVAVQYPRTLNRELMRNIRFTLPAGTAEEDVRVLGYRSPKFPARFAYGKKLFSRSEGGQEGAANIRTPLDRLQAKPLKPAARAAASTAAEPDLWHLAGDRLLYYNQFRGLQVLDLSDPTNPLRTGALRLPLTGERMWVLDAAGTQVALLGNANGKERAGKAALFLLRITDGVPELVNELPMEGTVTDARLSGTRLHLLARTRAAGQTAKVRLVSLELEDIQTPVKKAEMVFAGSAPFFQEEGSRLMVGVKDGGQTRLHEVKVEGGLQPDLSRENATTQVKGYEVRVSGQELRVRNAADATEPPVTLSLAWRTDRVLPVGDFLVHVEDGSGLGGTARLRVTPASDPDLLVQEVELGQGRVVGLTRKDDQMFIAQWVPATGAREAFLRTWALDLADPSLLKETGSVEQDLHGLDEWDLALDRVQPLWVQADRLLWFIPAQHHPRLWWSAPMAVPNARPQDRDLIPASYAVMVLCAVRNSKGGITAEPSHVQRIRGRGLHTSTAFAEAGFVFFSHDSSDETARPAGITSAQVKVPLRPRSGQVHSWLQVVDFRHGAPVLRDPVSIPGQLLSIAQADAQGAVLLTHADLTLRRNAAPIRVVQASGYDGVAACQLDSYITATTFHSAFAADGPRLYLTRETGRAGVVGLHYQSGTGKLSQVSTWNTNAAPALLHVSAGHLVASNHGNLELAGIETDTGKLTPIASYDTPARLWLQVDRSAVTPTLDLWIPAGDFGVEFLQKQAPGP